MRKEQTSTLQMPGHYVTAVQHGALHITRFGQSWGDHIYILRVGRSLPRRVGFSRGYIKATTPAAYGMADLFLVVIAWSLFAAGEMFKNTTGNNPAPSLTAAGPLSYSPAMVG